MLTSADFDSARTLTGNAPSTAPDSRNRNGRCGASAEHVRVRLVPTTNSVVSFVVWA